MTNIAYLGPEGSFSHIAAFLHVENAPLEQLGGLLKPAQSIREVFEAVQSADCRYGIVPYENSLGGNIAETLEGFDRYRVTICGEIYVPINHVLMANPLAVADGNVVHRVYSKYEVFGQCHEWLEKHLAEAERISCASTADAARLAKKDGNGVAIGSQLAARYFKMDIVEYNLNGDRDNFTRFLVIAPSAHKPSKCTLNDKTTVRFSVPHEPGTLVEVLKIFCVLNVNLTHLALVPKSLSPMSRAFF
ncbi:MAG: hypothetical protein KAV87_30335, partial [Desulfobacteraceae bacterium]|nr:hypothetical protein [Desulfobacteraceae bacterium]